MFYLSMCLRCTLIQSLQQLLFASSTTAQPVLTPRVWAIFFKALMKELDEMEKINAKLSAAVEEATLEHYTVKRVRYIFIAGLAI